MIWILYALAFFWIAAGAIFILYTEESRRFLKNSMGRVKPKFLAPIPMVFGLLLILSARASGFFWFIVILGLLAIGKGVYLLVAPHGQIEALLNWWSGSAQDRTYRLWGLIIVLLGMVVLSWM
jgi:hypothetical protein